MRILVSSLVLCVLLGLTVASPILLASPDYISDDKATITVKWSGIVSPSAGDYIGVQSPADGPLSKRQPWTTFKNTNAVSSGMIEIELLNWRSTYRFIYYAANGDIVSQSNVVKCNQDYPMHIHLALGDQPNSMRVMWITGSNNSASQVSFGFAQDDLEYSVPSTSSTYDVDDMCGLYAKSYFLHPGVIHDAQMPNLPPNTQVWYRIRSSPEQQSAVYSFRTAPVTGPDSAVSLFAFGDSGVSYCQNMEGWCEPPSGPTYLNIKSDMESNSNYSLIVHIGDIAYAVGYANRWEQFFHEISPIATRVPYMVSIGNHEYDWSGQPFKPYWGNYGDDSHGECGIPFTNRFHMPGPKQQSLWYSFDYGNIHFTFMSAEHDMEPGSEQYTWLYTDLASVDRSRTPFIIFSSHRPLYTTETEDLPPNNRTSYIEGLRMNIEPLLAKFQVDLALWAHVHAYERTCPIYNLVCTEGATTHAVIGMGGMDLATEVMNPLPAWIAYREIDYGYTRIITDSDSLTLQFVNNNGRVVKDQFKLKRKFY